MTDIASARLNIGNGELVSYDLGFAVMPNGDVVTSDGLPRGSLPEVDWPQMFGKPLTFRKPYPHEQDYAERMNRALSSSLATFIAKGVV